jgi:pimeloyl-ACP methyl ester carboxylesterase
MYGPTYGLPLLLLAAVLGLAVQGATAAGPLDPARVKAIAAMLPEHPQGVGRPAADRAAWDKLAAQPAWQQIVRRAEGLRTEPVPQQPDELFLEFSRTGNRTHWQDVAFGRRGRLSTLVFAECVENKGRFIPAIAHLIAVLCAERTWVLPAHDGNLANFNGKIVDIDLGSSDLGWNLATADWLLGDRLPPAARKLLRDNVKRRITDPFHDMILNKRLPNWWLLTNNNWNAVCLAGVTGAALGQVESRETRAEFVAAAEKFSRNFLSGFTPDGYCSEGLGYWNYGFGNYLLLAETVRQATGGKLDLLSLPEVRMPAGFGARIAIIGSVSPAFADCAVDAKPASSIMYFVNRVFGLGLHEYDNADPGGPFGSLGSAMIYSFPNAASSRQPVTGASEGPGLRTWFDKAGILIGRPVPGSNCRMGVALKGGNNAENHNHNDVGSYVVVLGKRAVLLDPGPEVYTARTFSSHRYDSKLLNSFGHSVPLVAGKLQREGALARAEVLQADFSDQTDTLKLDIGSAYPCRELKTLTRTFVYSRGDAGALAVTDRVEFTTPQTFGTALITRGSWQRQPDGSLAIHDASEAVRVEIDTVGAEYTVDAEAIHEDAPVQPTRIGINLVKPVTTAAITVRITPLAETTVAPLFPGPKSAYHGFDRYDFRVDGCDTIVVAPKQAAPGRPWIWRAEFFDHRPEADVALLAKGFHLVYITVGNTFGCPDAMAHWGVLYRQLTGIYRLSSKPALEGLSRGGLYVYNWAAANPDKLSCLYGDAPVCDFKSWPGGKGKGPGSPDDWKQLINDYHFKSEAEALAYKLNPIDNLEPLARAKVPILHVYGDADEVVPWDENTGVIKERYEKLGGSITLIVKHGCGHHPHALDDPTPIVDFVLKHTPPAQ